MLNEEVKNKILGRVEEEYIDDKEFILDRVRELLTNDKPFLFVQIPKEEVKESTEVIVFCDDGKEQEVYEKTLNSALIGYSKMMVNKNKRNESRG